MVYENFVFNHSTPIANKSLKIILLPSSLRNISWKYFTNDPITLRWFVLVLILQFTCKQAVSRKKFLKKIGTPRTPETSLVLETERKLEINH